MFDYETYTLSAFRAEECTQGLCADAESWCTESFCAGTTMDGFGCGGLGSNPCLVFCRCKIIEGKNGQ